MATIDYYFTPISGFAYLGHGALMDLAADTGATVRFLPVDIQKVFAASGTIPPAAQSDIRRSYRAEDQARWAALRGVPINTAPAHWPVPPALACRAILAAGHLGVDQGAVSLACLRAVWAEDRNISDADDLAEALTAIGAPVADILTLAASRAIADEAGGITTQAIEAGVFGSPTYVVDGVRFWGQDRLEFVRAAVTGGA